MKQTITTNSTATVNYLAAADDILNLFECFGFTTDALVDPDMLRGAIVTILRQQIEGNVNCGVESPPSKISLSDILNGRYDDPNCGCDSCRCKEEEIRNTAEESARHFRSHINENQ
jgi:hypothetical protein